MCGSGSTKLLNTNPDSQHWYRYYFSMNPLKKQKYKIRQKFFSTGLAFPFLGCVGGGNVVDPAGQHHVHRCLNLRVLGHEGVVHVMDPSSYTQKIM